MIAKLRNTSILGSALLPILGMCQPAEQANSTITVSGSGDFTLTANVQSEPESSTWETSFAAGFGFSTVIEPEYGVKPDGNSQMKFVRDREAEDQVTLTSIALVHVSRSLGQESNYGFGGSFGVGKGQPGIKSYFFGGSLHFGHQAYVTVGVNWGEVPYPPLGEEVGEITNLNPETLQDKLRRKTTPGFFVAISYPFAGSRDGFLRLVNPKGN